MIEKLLTTRSQINQQIALKTIKKFGFSVTAVWNGQEALDYVLDTTHPKPSIILMDVQMPVLDGYNATHIIRHDEPFKLAGVRTIPIIAMTASAIQGDREKCQKAGMDDYLSKPVRGKLLEDMLVKWAVEGAREDRQVKMRKLGSSKLEGNNSSKPSRPPVPAFPPSTTAPNDLPTRESDRAFPLLDPSTIPDPESEGDRSTRLAEIEEKARALRDDKLIAASESAPLHALPVSNTIGFSVPSVAQDPASLPLRAGPPPSALTEENIGILVKDTQSAPTTSHLKTHIEMEDDGDGDSVAAAGGSVSALAAEGEEDDDDDEDGASSRPRSTVGSLREETKGHRPRPSMEGRRGDSEVTVTRANVSG